MTEIIYKIDGLKRPGFNKIQRMILKLNKFSMLTKFKFVKKVICRIYRIPITTTFNSNLICSAPNLILGENVGLSDTFIVAYAPIIIGDNCSFSFRNVILTSTHDLTEFSTVIAKPVIIGDNVWVTTNVTILPGITIGNNTVIGAGSVVTTDIPSNVFAAGNPCRVIKSINFKK